MHIPRGRGHGRSPDFPHKPSDRVQFASTTRDFRQNFSDAGLRVGSTGASIPQGCRSLREGGGRSGGQLRAVTKRLGRTVKSVEGAVTGGWKSGGGGYWGCGRAFG